MSLSSHCDHSSFVLGLCGMADCYFSSFSLVLPWSSGSHSSPLGSWTITVLVSYLPLDSSHFSWSPTYDISCHLWSQAHLHLESGLFLSANATYLIAYEMFLLTWVCHGLLKANLSPARLTLFFLPYSHFQSSPTVRQMTFKPEPGKLSRTPNLSFTSIDTISCQFCGGCLFNTLPIGLLPIGRRSYPLPLPALQPSLRLAWITAKPSTCYTCPESAPLYCSSKM